MTYPLDPEIAAAIPFLPNVDLAADIAGARALTESLVAAVNAEIDTAGVRVRAVSVPGPPDSPDVPIRIYAPDTVNHPSLLFDVHGGAFITGSLALDHVQNIELARDLGVVVVSVGYRLAPEAPFPAPVEDCYAALTWVAKNAHELGVDPDRIVLHGASAGGGLCAALALLARDRGGPAIAFQFLSVPELDDRLASPSMQMFTDTPNWNRPLVEISWDCYLGPGKRGSADVSPYAAPARATDLTGLPPAYISVMEFDPMRDEGIAYAQALLCAGVTVELHLFPGTFHGSAMVRHASISRREDAERLTVLKRAVGGDDWYRDAP
ncbi:acetyl esterase/lipase [Mycobacterium sp. BK086]|uniref:alpha/beta hydrolase n=1 Tax=Mycobacterium sp. BK086 TaxID=2512165 RepID=UPI00105B2A99|nr:alpha/beta hydrolase [Mycobacterium sp. BK086]TDO06642.1 acetyl esterase/lipase [Mycobacterium sp. BK086]